MITTKEQRTYMREYYKKNKERLAPMIRANVSRFQKTPKGHYSVVRWNAKKRGLPFMSQDDFLKWYASEKAEKCFYCGVSREQAYPIRWSGKTVRRFSVERLDNTLGYSLGNIVSCCIVCNSTRSNLFSRDDMVSIGAVIFRKWINHEFQ